jgi:hypothetical protein
LCKVAKVNVQTQQSSKIAVSLRLTGIVVRPSKFASLLCPPTHGIMILLTSSPFMTRKPCTNASNLLGSRYGISL